MKGERGFGARLGLEIPPFGGCLASALGGKCATANVAVGYAPFPQIVLFELQVTYPIELG
jgi:hypothetical protein